MERKIEMKKQDLISAVSTVNLGEKAENEILNKTLKYAYKKECRTMSKKKICAIAAAAALAIGAVAYAASGTITMWCGSSASTPEYDSFPTSQQITKDIGYAPKMVETFSNGYTFAGATIVNNALKDESGNSVEKFKSVSVDYKNDDDKVIFSADKFESEIDMSDEVIDEVNGIQLHYSSYTNKVVPSGYELTDEDKQAEENGDLVFSYGSSEVMICEVQGLTWKQDGIQYNLTQIDGKLSADELTEMAVEIIN